MRLLPVTLGLLMAFVLSACDWWPKELKPVAESISKQVNGEATVWLMGGDALVVYIENSQSHQGAQPALQAVASEIAELALASVSTPLESIIITFYAAKVGDAKGEMGEFIYLVQEGSAVLQPGINTSATGPLTSEEIKTFLKRLGDSVTDDQKACAQVESVKRANDAGDPDTLDPDRLDYLPSSSWHVLDSYMKRIILTQAITTDAMFACVGRRNTEFVPQAQ